MIKSGSRQNSDWSRTLTFPDLKMDCRVLRNISVNRVLFGVLGYTVNGLIFVSLKIDAMECASF